MGDIFTASGAKLYIGPSVTTAQADSIAEFDALVWTEVGLVESLGEFGDESSAVTFAALGDARVRKAKGARDAGTMTVTCAHDPSDPGQSALIAAEGTNNNYPFKITLPNRLNATGTDEVNYFRALVMSRRGNIGDNANVVRRTFSLGINSQIYEKPATAGA